MAHRRVSDYNVLFGLPLFGQKRMESMMLSAIKTTPATVAEVRGAR
jgi:hypothetical protein